MIILLKLDTDSWVTTCIRLSVCLSHACKYLRSSFQFVYAPPDSGACGQNWSGGEHSELATAFREFLVAESVPMELWHLGPTIHKDRHRDLVWCWLGSKQRRGPWCTNLWLCKLAIETLNITYGGQACVWTELNRRSGWAQSKHTLITFQLPFMVISFVWLPENKIMDKAAEMILLGGFWVHP